MLRVARSVAAFFKIHADPLVPVVRAPGREAGGAAGGVGALLAIYPGEAGAAPLTGRLGRIATLVARPLHPAVLARDARRAVAFARVTADRT